VYGRELVDLRNENRWEFLNTLFSVSEAVMYMQVRMRSLRRPPEYLTVQSLEPRTPYVCLARKVESVNQGQDEMVEVCASETPSECCP
jgi:hypothetical protein